jgi:hypothetical protein
MLSVNIVEYASEKRTALTEIGPIISPVIPSNLKVMITPVIDIMSIFTTESLALQGGDERKSF